MKLKDFFKKPTYFYDPKPLKGKDEDDLYFVNIYKYHRGKIYVETTFAGKKYKKVMNGVHMYINSLKKLNNC